MATIAIHFDDRQMALSIGRVDVISSFEMSINVANDTQMTKPLAALCIPPGGEDAEATLRDRR